MPYVAIVVGVILVVAAWNETHGTLGQNLQQDLPGYFKWGAALAAIGALGFIPGLKVPSRYLLALVLIVVFLKNNTGIVAGFKNFALSGAQPTGSAGTDPTAAYTQNPTSTPLPTPQQIAGEAGGGGGGGAAGGTMIANAAGSGGIAGTALNLLSNPTSILSNPGTLVSQIESGFGGGALFGT